jgi:phosphoenolpyruvate-protein kinase (PTS system EI component)
LLAVEQTKGDSRSTIASLTRSFKAAEKEINEYRVLLRKKEESLERVVGEISSEKQGRLDAEHAYHARTKEFLTRFEAMKK